MTVDQLMNKLAAFPGEMEVTYYDGEYDMACSVNDVGIDSIRKDGKEVVRKYNAPKPTDIKVVLIA